MRDSCKLCSSLQQVPLLLVAATASSPLCLGRDEARLNRAPHSPGPGNSLRDEHQMGQNEPILEEETVSYPGTRTPNTHSLTWAYLWLHTNYPTVNEYIVIIFMNSFEEKNIVVHFKMKVFITTMDILKILFVLRKNKMNFPCRKKRKGMGQ